ncbi:MAG: PTS galactosamine transporter subunit IIB [Erysipelotrichaceae bacterium]|nr:PTS galactosamine transporter subunit IIB [Erysipelotrichaceae bacterium]
MPNILLTRIDNRLVHGQVGVTWTKAIGANLLLVADDTTSEDKLQQQLMAVTAKSSGAGIRFFSIQKTADIIGRAAPNQKIFIICRTPHDVRRLVELGVEIKEVNVGNMHFSEGKHAITKKVYVDDKDMEDLKFLASKGILVYAQDVPGESKHIIE